MRFWLTSFVLVFVAVELFDWLAHFGSWHPTGIWLIVGGVGLAALSNLPSTAITTADTKTTGSEDPVAQVSAGKGQKVEPFAKNQAEEAQAEDKESISFKVRPLKR